MKLGSSVVIVVDVVVVVGGCDNGVVVDLVVVVFVSIAVFVYGDISPVPNSHQNREKNFYSEEKCRCHYESRNHHFMGLPAA